MTDETIVGSVAVNIVPSAKHFTRDANRELAPKAEEVGRELSETIGDRISHGVGAGVRDGIENSHAEVPAAVQGRRSGASFSREFTQQVQTKLRAAMDALPAFDVDADATEAEQEINRLRMELNHLAAHVGVDIDDAEVLARIDALQARLVQLTTENPDIVVDAQVAEAMAALDEVKATAEQLGITSPTVSVDARTREAIDALAAVGIEAQAVEAESPTVMVDADVARAEAALAAVGLQAQVLARQSPTITPNVNAGPAEAELAALQAQSAATGSSMSLLVVAGLALAPAIVPAAAAATGAVAALGASLGAVAGAAGVAVLALKPVIEAYQAVSAASEQTSASVKSNADAVAGASQQVATAERNLANTRANVADQEVNAAQRVKDARQSLSDTRRSTAEADAQASQQVADAEQALTDAQARAKQAQLDLNAARQQGKRDLQQLQFQTEDAALAQRQAALSVESARKRLTEVMADPEASELQRKQAQLALDQAEQSLKEQTVRAKQLAAENKKAQKAGVAGTDAVRKAKQAEAQANDRVLAQQRALSEARKNETRVHQDGLRKVQKAEEQVKNAVRAQTSAARQGAVQIANAQASLATAQRALQKAYEQSGQSGSSSAKKVADAMAKLSPAGKEFLSFIMGAKGGLDDLSKIAQQGFLPGLEKGIKAMEPLLKPVTALVKSLSGVMGDLAEEAGKALGSPFWVGFVNMLAKNLGPWLRLVARSMGGFVKGLAALMEGFAPVVTVFLEWFAQMWESFGKWATEVTKTEGFRNFLAYIIKSGPVVGEFLKQFVLALGNVMRALAPLGIVVLKVATWLAKMIAAIDPKFLTVAFGVLIGGFIALKVAMFAMSASPVTLIILAVSGLIAIIGVLWAKSKTFRKIVTGTWYGIKTAALAVWNWMHDKLVPGMRSVVNSITGFFTGAKDHITGAWDKIIGAFKTAWKWVSGIFKNHWKTILAILGGPIGLTLKYVIEHWDKITGKFWSAWHWIQSKFKPSWDGVQGIIMAPINGIAKLFERTVDGWKKIFKGAKKSIGDIWDDLKGVFMTPISWVVNHVMSPLISGINKIIPGSGPIPTGWMKNFAADGTTVPGPRTPYGDRVPYMLAPGEEVISNRHGQADAHRPLLKAINAGAGLTGLADGGTAGRRAWSGIEWYRPWLRSALVDEMRKLQKSGWSILEMMPFDRVDPVHSAHSLHYLPSRSAGDAADISRPGMRGGDHVAQMLEQMGFGVKWRVPGHYNHIHVDTSLLSHVNGEWSHVKGGAAGSGGLFGWIKDKVAGWIGKAFGKFGHTWPVKLVTEPVKAGIPKLISWAWDQFKKHLNPLSWFESDAPSAKSVGVMEGVRAMAAGTFGWTGPQWTALRTLVQNESGWRVHARNPSSGAYGLFQALPASKIDKYGPRDSWQAQANFGLNYIADRYGNPMRALHRWMSRSPHWYADGTMSALPGLAWIGENGPELVNLRGGEQVYSAETSARMAAAVPVDLSNDTIGRLARTVQHHTAQDVDGWRFIDEYGTDLADPGGHARARAQTVELAYNGGPTSAARSTQEVVREVGDVYMNVSVDDLDKMSRLGTFLETVQQARVNARMYGSTGPVPN